LGFVGPEANAEALRRSDPSRNIKGRNNKGTAIIVCLALIFPILSFSISYSKYLDCYVSLPTGLFYQKKNPKSRTIRLENINTNVMLILTIGSTTLPLSSSETVLQYEKTDFLEKQRGGRVEKI